MGLQQSLRRNARNARGVMAKLSVRDVDVRGKSVLTRVDFNVQIKERGDKIEITDYTRIREALPTINYLRQQKAKTILMSHFGWTKRKRDQKYTLRPVGDHLHNLIDQPVIFSDDVIGEVPKKIVAAMKDGDVALLQNLRFHPGEEANDPKFASALAEFGDVYVNDAFGAAHRAHASTVGVTMFFEKRAMGFLMEKELKYLHEELDNPAKPFVVIMGGAKVSDKIGVLKALMKKAETILIGGAMANTFFKAQGIPIGASRVEADKTDLATQLIDLVKERRVKFLLPIDVLEAQEIRAGAPTRNSSRLSREHGISDGWQAVDICDATIALFEEEISKAKQNLWHGTVGIFKNPAFTGGTVR